jgi:hypothetical protein
LAGNYQLLDEESTKRMEFRRDLPDPKRGNLPDETVHLYSQRLFRRDYWLLDEEYAGRMEFRRIINSKGSLPHKTNFLKFKHENVI